MTSVVDSGPVVVSRMFSLCNDEHDKTSEFLDAQTDRSHKASNDSVNHSSKKNLGHERSQTNHERRS